MRYAVVSLICAILCFVAPIPGAADQRPVNCEEKLEPQRAHFLKRIKFVRPLLAEKIESLKSLDDAEFWLNAAIELKREQGGFSDIYLLPKGDQRLSEQEKATLFSSYSSKFTQPTSESEWSRFYFNHLQSLMAYASARLKESWVKKVALDYPEDPQMAFDAAIFPIEIEDCTVNAARFTEAVYSVTSSSLISEDTQRRIKAKIAGSKPCCKVEGGCVYCAHNRRQLR